MEENTLKDILADTLKKISFATGNIEKINVRTLADQAGISRTAYYYHFADIYELYEYVIYRDADQLIRQLPYCNNLREVLQLSLEQVLRDRCLIRLYLNSNRRAFVESIMRKSTYRFLESTEYTASLSRYSLKMISAAISGIYLQLIDEDCKKEDMVKILDFMHSLFQCEI